MGLHAKAALFLARKERAVHGEQAQDRAEAAPLPDEKGIALQNRIKKLSGRKTAAYIALGLIKNYGSFQAGALLRLADHYYTSYASVGMGLGSIGVPEETIFLPEHAGQNFFSINSGSLHMGISFLNPSSLLYFFPLDTDSPWTNVLLLAGDEDCAPENISVVLPEILEIIIPEANPLETALIRFNAENPVFGGILLSMAGNMTGEEKAFFLEKLARMVSLTGKIIPLGEASGAKPFIILILLPESMDRELIAHRLDATLPVSVSLSFQAESSAEVLGKLASFL